MSGFICEILILEIMKKLILISGVLFSLLISRQEVHAQNQSVLSLGPVIGFGHSGVSNVSGMSSEFRSSFLIGFTATYSTQTHWGYGADILYSLEGGKYSSSISDYRSTLGYIRVPLRAGYYFNETGARFRPKITLGPTLGFIAHAQEELQALNITIKNNLDKSEIRNFDLGLEGAVGFNYSLSDQMWLTVDIGYYQGLLDVYKAANSGNNLNNNLRLKAGVTFGL